MEKVSTDSLRSVAAKWSLGGDKQLLDLLQNIHQKIITKCTETNTKLDSLIDSLDTASIDLQNVNNKFMGLSKTQFIERRVYDDDIDITPEVTTSKEPQKPSEPSDDLADIKESIEILESMHEVVQILDSDSSDEEDGGRLVLKPKDIYANRPLPHIIGSEMWRRKWHVGLLVEDSDTDSAGSKPELQEEYSDSEPEVTDTQTNKQFAKDITISSSTTSVDASSTVSSKPAKPADIAAELARRLGGDTIPSPPKDSSPPQPTTTKVYRPEQPTRATIFFNEPPPLDQYESDKESETEEDIFADLHRNRYTQNDRNQPASSVVDELFAPVSAVSKTLSTKDESPLQNEPELFVEKPIEKSPEVTKDGFKKPVGGVSLFGSKKDSNSIGAAILKRHQHKSSDDESDNSQKPTTDSIIDKTATKNTDTVKNSSDSRTIIDDLFVKPKPKKKISNVIQKKEVKEEKKEVKVEKKVDLFSDNLFDDIDDIFTSNVIIKRDDAKSKSIIDDLFADIDKEKDENELFSEKILPKTTDSISKSQQNRVKAASFLDSEDLFKDDIIDTKSKIVPEKAKEEKLLSGNENIESHSSQPNMNNKEKIKSIFDDDSDDDLFNDNTVANKKLNSNHIKSTNLKASLFDDDSDEDLFSTNKTTISKNDSISKQSHSETSKSFGDLKENVNSDTNRPKIAQSIKTSDDKNKQISIFNDDSDEELFGGSTKSVKTQIIMQPNLEQSDESKGVENKSDKKDLKLLINDDSNLEDDKIKNIDINDDVSNNILEEELTNKIESIDNRKLNVLKSTVQIQSPSIFDDDDMDDLFSNKPDKSGYVTENLPGENNSPIENIVNKIDSTETGDINDKFSDLQEQALFDETPQPLIPEVPKIENVNNDQDLSEEYSEIVVENTAEISLFTDIFNNIPPEFEKPKEPKRSKNVNALFDDDSDDESLFFKKDSEVVDEIPIPTYTNDSFTIFHDEPPAIEVAFTPEPVTSKKNIIESSVGSDNISNIQSNSVVSPVIDNISKNIDGDFLNAKETSNFVAEVKPNEVIEENYENKASNLNSNETRLEESIKSTNAIIADAINKLQTDNTKPDENETKPKNIGKLKSVNFNINVSTLLPGASPKKSKLAEEVDGSVSSKPDDNQDDNLVNIDDGKDSAILDNKLSKERAKIQVKRRPSTRRARKEAARKSGIDFGGSADSTDNSNSVDEPKTQKDDEKNEHQKDILEKDNRVQDKTKETNVTKVVYILNDEDIFSDLNENFKDKTDLVSSKDANSSVDSDENCTDKLDSNQNTVEAADKSAKSIFDLSDSPELFGTKTVKVTPKAKLFDSDSDDDLFTSKIKVVDKTERVEKKEMKSDGSLFGERNDLFDRSKRDEKSKETFVVTSEPVFNDPLSMLSPDSP